MESGIGHVDSTTGNGLVLVVVIVVPVGSTGGCRWGGGPRPEMQAIIVNRFQGDVRVRASICC